jgi:hypothetical protein
VRCVLKLLHDDRVDLLHKPAEQVKPVKGEAKRPQEDMVGFGVEGRFAELPQRECSQASAAGRVPHLSRARCRSVPEGGCQESEAAPPHAAEAAATVRRRAGRELFCRLTASRPAPRLGKRAQAAARQAWRRAETACAPRLEGAQWRANSAMSGCFWRRGLSCGSDGCVWLRLQVVGHAPNARLWKTPPAATPASGIRCDDAQERQGAQPDPGSTSSKFSWWEIGWFAAHFHCGYPLARCARLLWARWPTKHVLPPPSPGRAVGLPCLAMFHTAEMRASEE